MGSAELQSIVSLQSLTWRDIPGFTEMIINEPAGRWAGGQLWDRPPSCQTHLRTLCLSCGLSRSFGLIPNTLQLPSRRGQRGQPPGFITGMSSESNRQVLIKH